MNSEDALGFVGKAVKNMGLDFRLAEEDEPLPPLDKGLRNLLRADDQGGRDVRGMCAQMRERTIYQVLNAFFCRYIVALVPGERGRRLLAVGPYTSTEVSEAMIADMLEEYGLSPTLLPHMVKYYSGVPILFEDSTLLALMDAFGETVWGRDDFSFVWEEYPWQGDKNAERPAGERDVSAFDAEILETRYQNENQLMAAIAAGQAHKAEQMINTFTLSQMERRQTDALRDVKNYLVILNTVMRKAAEQGGVHPLHIDRLSGQFALRIEELREPGEAKSLVHEMIQKYCLLVKNQTVGAYSLPVQRAVTNIDYDLTADLSLHAQARLLEISPSYLSSLFRKETGTTFTEYVNRRRMEQAAVLLRTTSRQIQSIAQQCGVQDVNYFTKLFKKYHGYTPMEYRRSRKSP